MPNPAPAPQDPIWLAVDGAQQPLRVWTMRGLHAPSQIAAPRFAQSLEEALALEPEADVVVSGLRQLPDGQVLPALTTPQPIAPLPADLLTLAPQEPAAVGTLGDQERPTAPRPRKLCLLRPIEQARPEAHLGSAAACAAGFLSLNPGWDGVICLPDGRMTHWLQLSAGEIVSFQSCVTPELFSLLTGHDDAMAEAAPNTAQLVDRMQDCISRPERMSSRIAEIREARTRGTLDAPGACGALWGALLGAEFAATRPYWLGQNLALVAQAPLLVPYGAGFAAQGMMVQNADAEAMFLRGLAGAAAALKQV